LSYTPVAALQREAAFRRFESGTPAENCCGPVWNALSRQTGRRSDLGRAPRSWPNRRRPPVSTVWEVKIWQRNSHFDTLWVVFLVSFLDYWCFWKYQVSIFKRRLHDGHDRRGKNGLVMAPASWTHRAAAPWRPTPQNCRGAVPRPCGRSSPPPVGRWSRVGCGRKGRRSSSVRRRSKREEQRPPPWHATSRPSFRKCRPGNVPFLYSTWGVFVPGCTPRPFPVEATWHEARVCKEPCPASAPCHEPCHEPCREGCPPGALAQRGAPVWFAIPAALKTVVWMLQIPTN